MIYRNRSHYIWSTALGAIRLPHCLDGVWRKMAYKPRVVVRHTRKRR